MRKGRCGFVLACLFGIAVHACMATYAHLSVRWPEEQSGARVRAEVTIESIPVAGPLGWSFDASVSIVAPAPPRTLHARVLWRDYAVRPRAGERWMLLMALRPPRARLNPGGVDLELHYFRQRIHALGTIVPSSMNRRIDDGHRPLTALRERITERISQRVADRDAAALIAALAVGADGAMSREQWRVFNATGTTHLVAISGLHVTLFAVLALAAAGAAWRFGIWRVVPVSRDVFAACAGMAAATAYALLAGFSVPTQRTLMMLGAWLYARSSARVCAPATPLGAALIVILLMDPFALLSAGFWLSFGAMCAIVLVTQPRLAPRGRVSEAVSVQVAVSLALVPFTLAWFSGISLAGLFVNAVAIPVFSIVLVPLVLLAVAAMPFGDSLCGVLLEAAAMLYSLGWPWMVAAASSPAALVHASPPWWWYVPAIMSIALSLMPWPMRLRAACLVWLIPLAAGGRNTPPQGGFELTLLDAGRTTIAVVRTSKHALVYSAGGGYGATTLAVEYVLLPFLRASGIRSLSAVVISRLSPQRSVVLSGLLATFPVEQAVLGASVLDAIPGSRRCMADDEWVWDGVRFNIVYAGRAANGEIDCVLQVVAPGGRILLPGHIDLAGESALVNGGLSPSDIVVVPRSGSNTASSPLLVGTAGARWALLAGSRRSSGGDDRPAVARWESHGARVLATGDSGAIRVTLDPVRGVGEPRAYRRERPAPWRGEPYP